MYVGRCEECGNSVLNKAANFGVQTLGCNIRPLVYLAIFFSCLSELGKGHVPGINSGKNLLATKRVFPRKNTQENRMDKQDSGCYLRLP